MIYVRGVDCGRGRKVMFVQFFFLQTPNELIYSEKENVFSAEDRVKRSV